MITVDIRGLDEVKRTLERGGEQAAFAVAKTLTQSAQSAQKQIARQLAIALPGASPYSLNSAFFASASKTKLTAVAGIKDKKPARGTAPAVLLKEHFSGTQRGNKPMEKVFMSIGILPQGWRVVPGSGMPRDRYGNPKASAVGEIIGALKTGFSVYAGKGKRMSRQGYFVAPINRNTKTLHLAPGIYQRIGSGSSSVIKPMFLFVQVARYRKVIDLDVIAKKVMAEFGADFAVNYADALRTAR